MGQERDVFLAFPERRDLKRDDAQAIKEILPKGASTDLFQQILVGSSDDPDIHGEALASADPFKGLLLKDTEDLGLCLQAHVPHLIEEDRGPVS